MGPLEAWRSQTFAHLASLIAMLGFDFWDLIWENTPWNIIGLDIVYLLVLGVNVWVSLKQIFPAGNAATICLNSVRNACNYPM